MRRPADRNGRARRGRARLRGPRPGASVLAGLAALLLVALAVPAAARPFTVGDLLKLEAFGEAKVDPSGRWLVFDRTDPYDSGSRYDADLQNELALSRLYLVDLDRPGPARRLLLGEAGPGHVAGPFSPSGARLAVYRFQDRRWDVGVAEVPGGTVRWLNASPEYNLTATTAQWLDDGTLLVLARTDGRPPWVLRRVWEVAEQLPGRWAVTAAGGVAASVFASGPHRDLRPPRPPVALLRIDARTGARTTLATGDLVDMELSPDGRHVALLESAEALQPQPGHPVQGAMGLAMERRRLVLVDLRTGARTVPCETCDVLETLLAWSPDGRSLLAHVRPKGAAWTEGRLMRHDLGAPGLRPVPGAVRPAFQARADIVRAGWMGNDPVAYGRPAGRPQARPDWFRLDPSGPVNLTALFEAPPPALSALDPDGLTLVADGAAWRVDRRGYRRKLAAEAVQPWALPRTRFHARAALGRRTGDALGLSADGARFMATGPDGRTAATRLPAEARVVAWSPTRHAAAVLVGQATRPQALQVIGPTGAVEVATGNDHLRGVDMPRIVAIAHTGPDGQSLKSWLFLPDTPREAGRPPPLVVRPYLGSSFASAFPATPYVDQFTVSIEALAGHGYAVLLPSLPKPRTDRDFVTGLAARLLAIVDQAADDPALAGAFDRERMALWSHSYGGYTIGLILTQTDRFKAAVASSSPMELASMFGTFQPSWRIAPELGVWAAYAAGWTEDGQAGLGGPPWAFPERYTRSSPIYQADRIRTPFLLFHGDQDFISPIQSEMMFASLHRQDKDALLVTYWGEGHALGSPGVVRDRYARGFDWLERYVVRPAPAAQERSAAPEPRS